MTEETLHFLILSSVEGLGCRRAHRLLDFYRTPSAVFSAPAKSLIEQGVPEFVAKALLSEKQRALAEANLAKCQQNNVQILTFQNDDYPKLLKEIYDPPITLFVKGDATCLNRPTVSIVGSRRATPSGINTAEKLARPHHLLWVGARNRFRRSPRGLGMPGEDSGRLGQRTRLHLPARKQEDGSADRRKRLHHLRVPPRNQSFAAKLSHPQSHY